MERWNERLCTLTPEQRRAMEFLMTHLPESDLDQYPFDLFLQFVTTPSTCAPIPPGAGRWRRRSSTTMSSSPG